jgi:cytochrome c
LAAGLHLPQCIGAVRRLGDIAVDGFELNKVAGAVLTAMLVIASGKTLVDIGLRKHAPEKAGWALPVTKIEAKPAEPEAPFEAKAVLAMLPKASAENGQDTFKKCLACHTSEKGGRNLVGPNLWGIVGRKVADISGFNYSEAMKKQTGAWNWEQLAKYLHSPAEVVPGNRMQFPGVKDNADLADLLVYLRKLADTPAALPQ